MAPEHRPSEAAIREQAYYLWEQDGRPEGHDMEYWQRATVAVTDREQLATLTDEPPKRPKRKAAELRAPAKAPAKPAKAKAAKAKPATRAKPKKK